MNPDNTQDSNFKISIEDIDIESQLNSLYEISSTISLTGSSTYSSLSLTPSNPFSSNATVYGDLIVDGDLTVNGDLIVSGSITSADICISKLEFLDLTMGIPEEFITIMLDRIKDKHKESFERALESLLYSPNVRLFSEDFILNYTSDILKNDKNRLVRFSDFYKSYLDNMPRLKLLLDLNS